MTIDEANPSSVYEEQLPTQPPGVLGVLGSRRQQIIDSQHLTLEVPRWADPKLKIEFMPIHHSIMKRGALEQERAAKNSTDAGKQSNAELDTNADILINACVRIIAILADGSEMGLGVNGAYTRFDSDTAVSLGLPSGTPARQVCRSLFITDADLLGMAKRVGEWTGYRVQTGEEELAGES
jgi:hypothetical protein